MKIDIQSSLAITIILVTTTRKILICCFEQVPPYALEAHLQNFIWAASTIGMLPRKNGGTGF